MLEKIQLQRMEKQVLIDLIQNLKKETQEPQAKKLLIRHLENHQWKELLKRLKDT